MGIGKAGTTAVDPSNPLYDAVKAGGGFVKDEETGEVTGGPDGDGTARTYEERINQANNPMGDDPNESRGIADGEGRAENDEFTKVSEIGGSTELIESIDDAADGVLENSEPGPKSQDKQASQDGPFGGMSTETLALGGLALGGGLLLLRGGL